MLRKSHDLNTQVLIDELKVLNQSLFFVNFSFHQKLPVIYCIAITATIKDFSLEA